MTRKEMKSGTGAYEVDYDLENQVVKLDFFGNSSSLLDKETNESLRNDASIFFFSANSYRNSFELISNKLKDYFNDNDEGHIEHLIMPYYFNLRHYLELEFKALIIGLTKRAPEVSHCLKKLYKEAKKAICSNIMIVCDVDEEKSGLSKHGDGCEELCKVIIEIGALLDEYLQLESSADYYRYIFTSKMTLEKPVIELDYKKQISCLEN